MKIFYRLMLFLVSAIFISKANAYEYTGVSFSELDKRATQGTTLNVVFIGGSLTWGALSSDPQLYSTRALISDYLIQKYPKSAVRIFDSAIGGTGSNLGLFRLERDVLRHKPDLVFIDCTVNDKLFNSNEEPLYTYETMIRTLVDANIPVVQIIFGVKKAFKNPKSAPYRRTQHLTLGEYYNLAVGDVFPWVMAKLKNQEFELDKAYLLTDSTHPNDLGYAIFAEAIIRSYEKAVKNDIRHKLPSKPLFGMYKKVTRIDLYKTELQQGWMIAETQRTGLWFDGQASRWMDKVVVGTAKSAPLKFNSFGSFLGILGEASESTAPYYVRVDGKKFNNKGKLVDLLADDDPEKIWKSTKKYGVLRGNIFFWEVISQELPEGKHEVEIIPLSLDGNYDAMLKIGSICFASELVKNL